MVTIFFRSEIELDEIARLENAAPGNAVDDFVVDTDADVSRKTIDDGWRGASAVFGEDFGADIGEFRSGDAGANSGDHGAQGFGDNAATGAEFFELLLLGDGHGVGSV